MPVSRCDEPFAPAHLQRLARDDDEHADAGDHDDEPGEGRDREAERRAVAALQRVEEDAVPLVDRDVDADVGDDERGERDRQEPGPPRRRAAPPALRSGARTGAPPAGRRSGRADRPV